MDDTGDIGFLGLREDWSLRPDVVILQIPFEMTVSYGSGTSRGPASTVEASAATAGIKATAGVEAAASGVFE
ncbi:MAG: hypothetical protein ACPGJA_02760, partial [Candidatus Thalassarchaeaceae archaeon]